MLPAPPAVDAAGSGGEVGMRSAPRSPKGRSPVGIFAKPDETCENPNCKEMRRVERTMVNNLKQEVATLKMQISQLTQQVQRKSDATDAVARQSPEADSEASALRVALTEEAHAHGVAIAESSTKIAALKMQLAVREREVDNLKEKRARERNRINERAVDVSALLGTIRDLEPLLAEKDAKIQDLQAKKRADAVDVTWRSAAAELEQTAEKVKREAAEIQARLQQRVEAVEARAEGLRKLSLRQANALGLAALSEKQAAKQIDTAKVTMNELKEKHREEIEKRRKAAFVFSTLCAQQVVRAKATADTLRGRVGELEKERAAWTDVEALLTAAHAEAELRLKEADARVAELEAKKALATEQATALATTVAMVAQKQKATAHKLQDVETARIESELALDSAMTELRTMAGELSQLQGSVQTQMRVMGDALEHRDATGGLVQEVLRLALRRLRALEDSFGELVTGYVDDGIHHGALAAALKSMAHIDLVALAHAESAVVHAAALFDHFPTHKWRVHQLSHTLQVAMRYAPAAQPDAALGASAAARGRRVGAGGGVFGGLGMLAGARDERGRGDGVGKGDALRTAAKAPITAELIAHLDKLGALRSQPPQGPHPTAAAAIAAARAAGARARTPQAAVLAATRARAAMRAAMQGSVAPSDGMAAAMLLQHAAVRGGTAQGLRSASGGGGDGGGSGGGLRQPSKLLPPMAPADGIGVAPTWRGARRPASSSAMLPSVGADGAGAYGAARGSRAAVAAAAAASARAALPGSPRRSPSPADVHGGPTRSPSDTPLPSAPVAPSATSACLRAPDGDALHGWAHAATPPASLRGSESDAPSSPPLQARSPTSRAGVLPASASGSALSASSADPPQLGHCGTPASTSRVLRNAASPARHIVPRTLPMSPEPSPRTGSLERPRAIRR
ncbi:hypothetical protein KFE25_003506 [Diacronema lutheri]|uniref:Uncharacterized protein n=1 Tax=Diacronema lutheri TaxID=2081491 RepID=A0A8J5XHQ5_DIALT|nr:hypothetical protein KFE25_003506 [Diacronema lutheri]